MAAAPTRTGTPPWATTCTCSQVSTPSRTTSSATRQTGLSAPGRSTVVFGPVNQFFTDTCQ